MDAIARIFLILFFIVASDTLCYGLLCYTCSVDFRHEKFNLNHTCIFPRNKDQLAQCSSGSNFCKAVVTRIGGVFVMLRRTCSMLCMEACTERGFGIRTKDCTSCCIKTPNCGTAGLIKQK